MVTFNNAGSDVALLGFPVTVALFDNVAQGTLQASPNWTPRILAPGFTLFFTWMKTPTRVYMLALPKTSPTDEVGISELQIASTHDMQKRALSICTKGRKNCSHLPYLSSREQERRFLKQAFVLVLGTYHLGVTKTQNIFYNASGFRKTLTTKIEALAFISYATAIFNRTD
jgi:hypothetical protein